MTTVTIPLLIAGEWRDGSTHSEDRDPYREELVAMVPDATEDEVASAVAAAAEYREVAAATPAYERAQLLRRVADLVDENVEALATIMAQETGKAISDARAESRRCAGTLRLSAEEAVRITGEHVPLDASATGAGKLGFVIQRPVGVVAAITPFNAPLNLACHKLGPAIAAGNSVVLKPSPAAALVVHRLCELFQQAGAPAGLLNVVHGDAAGAHLIAQREVDFISFTGSSAVGAKIVQANGLRRAALELGGNGWTIVHDDADPEAAAGICGPNAMRLSGQSCISVQNVAVHENVADRFKEALVARVSAMTVGDPMADGTDIGTMIDETSARRVEAVTDEAISNGSTVLLRGKRSGAQLWPTILSGPKPAASSVCEEVFGPVVNILTYRDLDEVIGWINAGNYGLQTGLFSPSIKVMRTVMRKLRTGGLIVNGSSTWRVDEMPYGGVKASGIGREGPRYAIREMTDSQLVIIND